MDHGFKTGGAKWFLKQIAGAGFHFQSLLILFSLSPHPHIPILFDYDVNHIRSAADRAILDVLLRAARRQIKPDHDLLAAGIADVAGFVLHGGDSTWEQVAVE